MTDRRSDHRPGSAVFRARRLASVLLSVGASWSCSPTTAPAAVPPAPTSVVAHPPASEVPLVVGRSKPAPEVTTPLTRDAPMPASADGGVSPSARRGTGGPTAPPIDLPSMTTSGRVTLPEGRVVIVTFWATWCAPCVQSFPKLQELYAKYQSQGLEVVAISVDDEKDQVAAFARKHGAKFAIAWDEHHQTATAWQLATMPTTYVLDRTGAIAHTHSGYRDGEATELEREIAALL